MALETLKGVKEIGGFKVIVMDKLKEQFPEKFNESGQMDHKWFEKDIRPKHFIYVRNDVNSISFTVQKGPIKENGVNGCQVDTMIETAKIIIEKFSEKFPCKENETCIYHLDKALDALKDRKENRIARGVEGEEKI